MCLYRRKFAFKMPSISVNFSCRITQWAKSFGWVNVHEWSSLQFLISYIILKEFICIIPVVFSVIIAAHLNMLFVFVHVHMHACVFIIFILISVPVLVVYRVCVHLFLSFCHYICQSIILCLNLSCYLCGFTPHRLALSSPRMKYLWLLTTCWS